MFWKGYSEDVVRWCGSCLTGKEKLTSGTKRAAWQKKQSVKVGSQLTQSLAWAHITSGRKA